MATTLVVTTIILLSNVVHGFGGIKHFRITNRGQQLEQLRCQPPAAITLTHLQQRSACSTSTSASFRSSLSSRRKLVLAAKDSGDDNDDDDEAVGQGPNWIERSLPVGIGSSIRTQRGFQSSDDDDDDGANSDKVDDYNLGISGVSFGTGTLGKRMYDAIVNQNRFGGNTDDTIRRALTMYAMDFTAKEATRAALKQNGLEMVLTEAQEDLGMWGQVDSIRLLHPTTQQPLPKVYDSVEEALDDWTPGQAFDFVVRQVPARLRAMDLSELLQALDPDGTLRKSAKDANFTLPDEDDGDEDEGQSIRSLQDLANESVRRSEQAPRDVETKSPYVGKLEQRGYRIMKRSDLLKANANPDGTEKHHTLMHVMDAMVSHGCLVVDVSDGGTNFEPAWAMANMWQTVEQFFNTLEGDNTKAATLPSMTSVLDSPYAKVGYAAYDNGSMQFLETRWKRISDNAVLYPSEAADILGDSGTQALKAAFDLVTDAGKDVVRVATAACSVELQGFVGLRDLNGPSLSGINGLNDDDDDDEEDETTCKILASEAATMLANELMDDGKPLASTEIKPDEGDVSMSPHRICRYTDLREKKADDAQSQDELQSTRQREIFGAHTDSSFVTIVPVAAISGLEVFDEGAERWLRPELLARRQWEQERQARGEDPTSWYETTASQTGENEVSSLLPWHARYVVIMPGEFLQIVTRNEVPAAVHRVVAAKDDARLSAPILLRGRPGTKLDVGRYLGAPNHPILVQCNGMSMEEIHQAMQPTSFE